MQLVDQQLVASGSLPCAEGHVQVAYLTWGSRIQTPNLLSEQDTVQDDGDKDTQRVAEYAAEIKTKG